MHAPCFCYYSADVELDKTYKNAELLESCCHVCTGTPEIGGLTPVQAIEIVRGCRGLNLVGADCVEVSFCH